MDQAWDAHNCDNLFPDPEHLASFYNDPVWLLNGMFVEQDELSMAHRRAITSVVTELKPKSIVDFGGGFGTLARLLATAIPQAQIFICEPYPPQHGTASCQLFDNINFVNVLIPKSFDVLVSTDVLEHLPDPLPVLASMVNAVRPGGYLLIVNCFYPVIDCHLPCNFHFRYSFDGFCKCLGLEVIGPCPGSNATIYRRVQDLSPDWPRLRAKEWRSQYLFPWLAWRTKNITPWRRRAHLFSTNLISSSRKMLKNLCRKF